MESQDIDPREVMAQQLAGQAMTKIQQQILEMARKIAFAKDGQVLGQTEFDLRDLSLEIIPTLYEEHFQKKTTKDT
jgi:hypothetical protein